MKLGRRVLVAVSAVTVLAVIITAFFLFSRNNRRDVPMSAEFRSSAVMIATACIAATEKPSAVRVLLCGAESGEFKGLFETFGFLGVNFPEAGEIVRHDIVFVTGEPSEKEFSQYVKMLSEMGVMAWRINVRNMDCVRFKELFSRFPCPSVHLWMPGADEWLLVGRKEPRNLKMDAMMELFSRESAFDLLSGAKIFALSDIFASYAGTREDVEGAFAAGVSGVQVRPEFFVTKDVPEIGWVVRGDVDDDIFASVRSEMRSVQTVRREILNGNMLADQGKGDEALEMWMAATRRNPRDPMMQERLGRLTLNANALLRIGNAAAAAKCFETIIVIDPGNASAVFEYGKCLQMLGKKEMAEQVFKRAKELNR